MDLSVNDTDELRSRIKVVLERLDFLFKEVGPKVAELGRLREEYALISQELERRGVDVR